MPTDLRVAGNSACPRCGADFHCGANDAQPCQCSTLRLDEATLAALREQYRSCLCWSCLRQLQAAPGGG